MKTTKDGRIPKLAKMNGKTVREFLIEVLEKHEGRISKAAKELGVDTTESESP